MESTDKYKNIIWAVVTPYPIKRLNITDGAPVDKEFFNSMKLLGILEYDKLEFMFENDEWRSLLWYWEFKKLKAKDKVFIFRVNIEHHLRRGSRDSMHEETWLFGLISCDDETHYLCPFKRDSDFSYDVIALLQELCKIEPQYPWNRYSSLV